MPNPYISMNGKKFEMNSGPLFSHGETWLMRARNQLSFIAKTAMNLLIVLGAAIIAVPIVLLAAVLSLVCLVCGGLVLAVMQTGMLVTRILSLPVLALGGFFGKLFSKGKKASAEASTAFKERAEEIRRDNVADAEAAFA